jgi:hypothetical protein
MRLIGAGLPRTATLSQKLALELLGVGPCYHMVDVLTDLERTPQWLDALDGRANWDEIFAGYESTVDWPGSFFYRELRDVYPDAKVLLSVRSGESWARSMVETISGLIYGDTLMHDLSSARSRVDPEWDRYIKMMDRMWKESGLIADGSELDEHALARAMERYNEEVQATIDDVLVWSPADGWEPICELLDVPVPNMPFPQVNDSEMFAGRIVDSALDAVARWRKQQTVAVPQ